MKNGGNKHFSASHVMLYVILLIYVVVVVSGVVLLIHCIDTEDMDTAKVVFTALASMTTICGSTTAGFYAVKASRENILQITNGRSRMRLKLAKKIFKELKGKKLDETSLQLMHTLVADENAAADVNFAKNTAPGIDIPAAPYGSYSDERGAG